MFLLDYAVKKDTWQSNLKLQLDLLITSLSTQSHLNKIMSATLKMLLEVQCFPPNAYLLISRYGAILKWGTGHQTEPEVTDTYILLPNLVLLASRWELQPIGRTLQTEKLKFRCRKSHVTDLKKKGKKSVQLFTEPPTSFLISINFIFQGQSNWISINIDSFLHLKFRFSFCRVATPGLATASP